MDGIWPNAEGIGVTRLRFEFVVGGEPDAFEVARRSAIGVGVWRL